MPDQKFLVVFDYQGTIMSDNKVIPGMEDVIRTAAKYATLAIVSWSSRAHILSVLGEANLLPHFTEIVSAENLETLESKEKAIGSLLTEQHVHKQNCIFVTDTQDDMESAAILNIYPIFVTWGLEHDVNVPVPHKVVYSPKDLSSLLTSLLT